MSCWWWLTVALLAVGLSLVAAGFGTAVAVNGFPAPIQDMSTASAEELEGFYGRPPALASGLWWAGCVAVSGAVVLGVVSLGRSARIAIGRTRRCS